MPLGPGLVYSYNPKIKIKLVYYMVYGWWPLLSKMFLKENKVYHGKVGSFRYNVGLT